MKRNSDKVVSKMLAKLGQLRLQGEKMDKRLDKVNKRLDLTIKRMVKAEDRMEDFDKKLEQSIKDQRVHAQMQAKINASFLKQVTQQAKLLDNIIKKNGLKV